MSLETFKYNKPHIRILEEYPPGATKMEIGTKVYLKSDQPFIIVDISTYGNKIELKSLDGKTSIHTTIDNVTTSLPSHPTPNGYACTIEWIYDINHYTYDNSLNTVYTSEIAHIYAPSGEPKNV